MRLISLVVLMILWVASAMAQPEVVEPIPNTVVSDHFGQEIYNLNLVFKGDGLTYEAESSKEKVVRVEVQRNALYVIERSPGRSTISVTAIDEAGEEADFKFAFTVNAHPELRRRLDDDLLVEGFGRYTLSLKRVFYDPEHGYLTYEAHSHDEDIALAYTEDDDLIIEEGAIGITKIYYNATDDQGATTQGSFFLTVQSAREARRLSTNHINVYPNPARSHLHMEWEKGRPPRRIRLYNKLVNKEIWSKEISGELLTRGTYTLELDMIPKGDYSLYFVFDDEEIEERIYLR